MGGIHRKFRAAEGGVNRAVSHSYQYFQDLIFNEAQVSCSVMIKGGMISIRAKDYAEYLMAKSVLKKRCSTPIMRDVMHDDKMPQPKP